MQLSHTISKCEALEASYDAVTQAASQLLDLIHGVDADNASSVAQVLQGCMVDWDEHCEAIHGYVKGIDDAVLIQCGHDLGFTEGDVVMLAQYPECGCYYVCAIGLPNRDKPNIYTAWLSRIERVEGAEKNASSRLPDPLKTSGWVSAENASDLMFNSDAQELSDFIKRHPGDLNFTRAQLDACALRIVKESSYDDLEKILARIIDTDVRLDNFILNAGHEYLDTAFFKAVGYSVAGRDHVIALALMEHMAPIMHPQYNFNESDLVMVKFSDEKQPRVVVFVNIDVAQAALCYLDGEGGAKTLQDIENGDVSRLRTKPISKIKSMSLLMGKDVHGLDCSGPAEAVLLTVYAQKENLRMRIGRFAANQKA